MESKILISTIHTDRTKWIMTRFKYGSLDMVLPNGTPIENDHELHVEISMSGPSNKPSVLLVLQTKKYHE